MPRKHVYGKRSHVYSQFDSFASPVKPTAETRILEVDDIVQDLVQLNIQTKPQPQHAHAPSAQRQRAALGEKDNNTVTKPPRKQKKDKKEGTQLQKKESLEAKKSEEALEVVQLLPDTIEDAVVTQPKRRSTKKPAKYPLSGDEENCPPQHAIQEPKLSSSPRNKPQVSEPRSELHISQPSSNIFTAHASSLLALSSRPLTPFSQWSDQLSSHFTITKIAEASFGEVYRLSMLRSHPSLSSTDESVLKIIPLKPPPATLPKRMTKAVRERLGGMSEPEDVAGEVRLMQRMTCIPGFTNFRDMCIIQGRPGASFVQAWRDWNDEREAKGKEASYFPDPGVKSSYSQDQLWAVIEMQDAGTDLENVKISNVWMLWDAFWGVVLALGKGEEGARFEHRDLHLGNICIAKPGVKKGLEDWDAQDVDATRKLGFTGIETTLIDYTISRAQIGAIKGLGAVDDVHSHEIPEDVAFFDLEKDQAIFQGDSNVEYQYELYRHMRSAMYLDDPLADMETRWDEAELSGRTWRGYHPQTNLVWLHFVLHELIKQMEWPSSGSKTSKDSKDKLRRSRANELEKTLMEVNGLLEPENLPLSGLKSAGDLVALALEKGWFDVEDVIGSRRVAKSARKEGTARKRKTKATRQPAKA